MNARLRVAAICLALSALAGLVLLVVRPGLNPAQIRPLPLIAGAWIVFLCAAWLLRKVPLRASAAAILLGGIAIQLAAVSAPPRNSDDLYRYIWDGRVQAAGIDPYEYVPAARQVTGLRDELLWHPGAHYCVKPAYVSEHPAAGLAAGCTAINRPTVPTIYPPVAEAYFLGVHYLPGADQWTAPIQAATALAAVLTTVLLLFGLRRLGRDMRMAALWSWCPTVALEAGNSAHVDVIAVAITAAALLVLATARTTRKTIGGGVLLGLAIATKVTPVLTVPAVLRRRWLTILAAAGSAFVAVYVPHVIAVGSKVIGFLPGYLKQEGYTSGTRFGIIGLFVGGRAAIAVAVLVLAVVALAVLRYSDPDQPWRSAVVMTGAALAVTTPAYQWYALLLVMLVALDGRPEWLAFAAGAYYAAEPNMGRLTIPSRYHDAFAYGVPVLMVLAGYLVRRELARRGASRTEPVPVTAGTAAVDGPAVPAAADRVGAFLPVGYPWAKRQTAPVVQAVNEDMSYDPSYRTPPRQARWPHATPREGWPAYPARDGERDASQAWGAAGAFAGAQSGHAGYADAWEGYGGASGYRGATGGYRRPGSGYAAAGETYAQAGDSFDGGYGDSWDDIRGEAVYSDRYEYAEAGPAIGPGPALIAPDTIGQQGWLPGPDEGPGRDQDRSGLVIGAVTGFLAAAVAIGVATLSAAFVRPQASPIIAVGGAFIDRTPPAVKNFAVQHFGENDKTILLLGMYVTIAVLAMGIGCLARRNVTIGVAGLAAFGLFGAFVAITRPESRAADVIPSVAGGIAGIAALLWLARAAAPVVAPRPSAAASGFRHARDSRRRGAR
ncbi:MAG TPA: glycosyltransferase family 87 protein [Streptosporangiaceae bacterium]|nr:glycosyltransferase family 87 protein [Streptosporangiaceae bacterium]